MSTSITKVQREIVLQHLGSILEGQWKYLVCDKESEHLLDTIATRDEVLGGVYTDLQLIEDARPRDKDTPAVYFLTPRPYVVEWLRADVSRRRYQEVHLLWTSLPRQNLGPILDIGRDKYVKSSTALNIEYTSRESQLITVGEADSLQILFNPHCDDLVIPHVHELAQKIVSVCVSLEEYPIIRFYRPPSRTHEAVDLCGHIANLVRDGLNAYAASSNGSFPPPSPRPRATLLITDRSMDIMAPLVHELTYQAMAMDLLPIDEKDGKVEYPYQTVNEDQKPVTQQKELSDRDKTWVKYRHLHMKDLLIKLSDSFKDFQAKNIHFANMDNQNISVNTIKDMLAGLSEFQETKASFSLHIDMAEKCAKIFQDQKLLDVTSLEQSLATGLDEDNQRPKNITDQLVRLLGDESVVLDNRARLLIMYIIYRGGILNGDTEKLLNHGQLSSLYRDVIVNLQNFGVKIHKDLKESVDQYKALYPTKEVKYGPGQEVSLSRFEPMLRYALEDICLSQLNYIRFPSNNVRLEDQNQQANAQASLRSASKPTWANTRQSSNKPRQRIIVFMAGGATYSEARVCYDIPQQLTEAREKEIFLITTHMITPKNFILEAGRLHESRRNLRLKIDNAMPEMPQWMREPPPNTSRPHQPGSQQRPSQMSNRPPTDAMQNMNLGPPKPQNGSSRPGSAQTPTPPASAGSFSQIDPSSGKLKKEKKDRKFGLFKKH